MSVPTDSEPLGGEVVVFGTSPGEARVEVRLDRRTVLGLRFKDAPRSPLLVASKGSGQATHKVELSSVADVTSGVERLARLAYEQN